MAERHRERQINRPLIWAAGLAWAAVGATAIYDRFKPQGGARQTAPKDEFVAGRGKRRGPINAPSLAAGYEVADTDVRALAIIMVVSVTLVVIGLATVFRMYASFDRHFQAADTSLTAEQRAPIVPPLPHLQAQPFRDIDAMLMEQKRRLTSYGWDSPAGQRAHIPIERAMLLMVGKPLDKTAQGAAEAGSSEMAAPLVLPAAAPQDKPANRIQGEGRPGVVAPSYNPSQGAKP